MARIGDNWRLRYRGLKLHNKTPVNHLRYLPFPPTFPDYIPKDKIANWLESYVDIMEVDFWTGTTFDGADYDDDRAALDRAVRRATARAHASPKHIVLATSVSGTPNIPEIERHRRTSRARCCTPAASQAASEWAGRSGDRVRHRHQRA